MQQDVWLKWQGEWKVLPFCGFLGDLEDLHQFSGSRRIWLHAPKFPQMANLLHAEKGEGKKNMVPTSEMLISLQYMG